MAETQILRIRRTDDTTSHLLLNVKQTNRNKPLDLKLVATEHKHLYHGSVKPSGLASLQASNYQGDDDEWKSILLYALLHDTPSSETPRGEALNGVETVAAISGDRCTITIRKNIGGITQRLGSIKLDQDDEREEVSAFEWVDSAVAASDELRSRLDGLQSSMSSQQEQVAKLTKQLDELVQAKKDHEEQLLQKFAALLNTKKLKIRDQQRELMRRRVLSETKTRDSRKAGSSASGKRKANGSLPEDEEDMDGEPDDDDLDIEEEEGQRTPEQETEEEESDENDGFAPPPKASSRPPASQSASQKSKAAPAPMDVDGSDELPPRRELPFGRKAPSSQPKSKMPEPAPAKGGGDDDEDEDDETDDEL